MTISMLIPIAAFVAASGASRRKWIYILLVILAIPAPAVAATVGAIALAWLARHYAAEARPVATATLVVLAVTGWVIGTSASFQGYGMFTLLWILAGLTATGVMFVRARAAAADQPSSTTQPAPIAA